MSKIGKAIFVSGGMHFAFELTIGGTTYSFDEKSESSSVSNVYTYSRTKQGNVDKWSLVVYASGTLKFSKLKHLVDYCVVGGGGGGGGGSCGGSGYWTAHGRNGGAGGGGYYSQLTKKTLSPSQTYTLTIGAGGGGGSAGPDSRGSRGDSGAGGGTTSFGSLLSAGGGGGGGYGYDGGSQTGADGAGGSRQYCFGDTSLPQVSGKSGTEAYPSYRGAGGGCGSWHLNGDDPYATSGRGGAAGLIVIRSTPKE